MPPMKTKLILAIALLAAAAFAQADGNPKPSTKGGSHGEPEGLQDLKIGDPAPDFPLPGIDGGTHTLEDYKDAKLLMIAFISNHCPDAHAAEGRIKKLVTDLKGRGFALVAINPNNPEGLSIDELGYSKYNDGFDDIRSTPRRRGSIFPTSTTAKRRRSRRHTAAWPRRMCSFSMRGAGCATRGSSTIRTSRMPRR